MSHQIEIPSISTNKIDTTPIVLDDVIEILDIAGSLLTASDYKLLAGACNLHYLSVTSGLSAMPPFDDGYFAGLEANCRDLPIFEEFRVLCSTCQLQDSEVRIDQLSEAIKDELREKCQEIIDRYEKLVPREI